MTTHPAAGASVRTRAARLTPTWAGFLSFVVAVITAIPAALGFLVRLLWMLVTLLALGFVVGWETAGHQLGARSGDQE